MEREKLISLVQKAQQGDSAALDALFTEFYNDVYYFAVKTVKDPDVACDITQETFMEIIRTIGNLHEPAAFAAWMKQVTYHQCTRYFKQHKDVQVEEDEDGNSLFDTLADEGPMPTEILEQEDFRKTILSIIDELSEEQRAAVMLYYFDELTVGQIAEIQGVSEGTVKSRLNYARKSIKKSVEDYEKKHDIKLHSVALLPLLMLFFGKESMPKAAAAGVRTAVTQAIEGVATSAGTTAAATAATTAAAATAANAGAGAATTMIKTGTAVAKMARRGGMIMKLSAIPLWGKIIATIVAVAIAVGAAVAITTGTPKDETPDNAQLETQATTEPEKKPTKPTDPTGDPTTEPTTEPTTAPTEHVHNWENVVTPPTNYARGYTEMVCTGCAERSAPQDYVDPVGEFATGTLVVGTDNIVRLYGENNAIRKQYTWDPAGYSGVVGAPWLQDNRENVLYIIVPDGVTSIGSRAFTYLLNVVSATIGNGVTSIGEHAFSCCTSLTSITIPNGVTSIGDWAFSSCDNLADITIPNSVTSIGENAFSGCKKLVNITIPNSVTSIGEHAFLSCTSLTSITIPNGVTTIGERMFYNCTNLISVTLGNGVTSIGNEAFSNCTGLTGITIPNSVTSIGEHAFSSCTSLTDITIPNSVTSIGNSAFFNCTSLTGITIPNGVTTIGEEMFYNCTALTDITIPDSVTSVGFTAFDGCKNLNYNVYDNAKYLGNEANKYVVLMKAISTDITSCQINPGTKCIYNSAFSSCGSLINITIPNGVVNIGDLAFSFCDGLTSITIPDSVTSIGNRAFWYCDGMTNVTIGNGVTSIGDEAFHFCRKLTSITIPGSVASMGQYAFAACNNLTNVSYNGTVAQWQSVTKDNNWNSNAPATYVQCSDGTVEL